MRDVNMLREALPYIKKFKGSTFVVKIGGRLVEDPANLVSLTGDITLLHYVGIRVVVVHGGGSQATQLLQDLQHQTRFVNGRRITDAKTLDVAKMVYGGQINIDILSALRNHGVPGVGLSGVDANLIVAEQRKTQRIHNSETGAFEEVDFGFVGDIVDVNVGILEQLLDGGYIPVIASLGADMDGNIFNINADTVAEKIAVKIQADKFINMTNVRGILRDINDPDSLISYLDTVEAAGLIASGTVSSGMIPKVQSCIAAIKGGVKRTCLINGTNRNSLLAEVFTNEGHGTIILSTIEKDRYQAEELHVA